MSTLALAPCTLIFTGADLASVHEQITKYFKEKCLTEAPAPMPVPVTPALFPYETGLVKVFAQEELPAAVWPAYCELRDYGNSITTKIAVVAREVAAKHFPEHEALAGEYIYLRYLLGISLWHFCRKLNEELLLSRSTLQLNEFLTFPNEGHLGGIMCLSMAEFERLLHQAAAKLVKAGWKSHNRYNFAGTEFQKVAIICSKRKFDDDLFAGGSLRANKLDEELAKL